MVNTSTPWKRNPGGPQLCVLVMSACSAGAENATWTVMPSGGMVTVVEPTGAPPGAKPWTVTAIVPEQSTPAVPVSNCKDVTGG